MRTSADTAWEKKAKTPTQNLHGSYNGGGHCPLV